MTTRDPAKTRAALLEAAAAAFNEVGYHATNSNVIARAAGYAPQTFYRHFEDKLAIFLAVYEQWSEQLLAHIAEARRTRGGERARARAVIRAVVAHHRRFAVFRASLVALDATDEAVREARLAQRRRQLDAFSADPGCSRAALLYVMWACERVADGLAADEARALRVSESALVERLVDALLDALVDGSGAG